MYCPKCGKENQDGSRFCMHCGADLSGYKAESSPKIEVSPKISVSAKAEGYPRCPNCGNVLTDRNKLFSCQSCGKKVCDTCVIYYHDLKLCKTCKIKKEEEEERRQWEAGKKAAPISSAGFTLFSLSVLELALLFGGSGLIFDPIGIATFGLVGFLIVLILSRYITRLYDIGSSRFYANKVFIAGCIPYVFSLLVILCCDEAVVVLLFFISLIVGIGLLILPSG